MRVKGATIQRFALGAALLAALAWNLAHAAEVRGVRVATGATGTRAEISLDTSTDFKLIRLHSPERLAVDLPATRLGRAVSLPAGQGVVHKVRSGSPEAGTLRLVFDLGQAVAPLQPRMERGEGARLVIEWPGDSPVEAGAVAQVAAKPSAAEAAREATAKLVSQVTASNSPVAAALSDAIKPDSAAPVSAPGPIALITTAAATTEPASASNKAVGTTSLAASTLASAPAATGNAPGAAPVAPISKPAVVDRLQSAGITPATPAPAQAARAGLPPGARVATGVPAPMPGSKPASTADAIPPRPVAGVARPLIVAIDAGHGGQDPGASGLNGSHEKDVTLAIARELARQVNATPGLKAYLTRDSDFFIPLTRRTQLARQAHADIFVSIHADAAENRAARGSSVYVLSLKGASSQRARWLADKENAADLIGGVRLAQASGTLASVLLDLTQSGQMRASEDAAGHVLSGLKRIGYNHKPNIERANFAVLRTSDMPAMLVETAFISNPEEEQRLNDPEHRRALARAVLDGVNTYFTRQPPPGTLYAARAVSAGAGGM